MAKLWCCSARVEVKEPIKNVQGLEGKTIISVPVKCRTESDDEREPSDKTILKEARSVVDACYDAVIVRVFDPITLFILWDKV